MSSNPHHSNVRPLLEPSIDVPWAVDAVGAIPVSVAERSLRHPRETDVAATAVAGRWHAVLTTTTQSQSHSSQSPTTPAAPTTLLSVWYSASTASLAEQKKNANVVTLSHASLQVQQDSTTMDQHDDDDSRPMNEDDDAPPALIAVASPRDEDCYVYAIATASNSNNNNNPVLLLWKLQRHDLARAAAASAHGGSSSIPPVATTVIAVDQDSSNDSATANAVISSLNVHWPSGGPPTPMITVGTAAGQVFWVVQDHVPLNLRSYLVTDPSAHGGFFQSLLNSVSYKGGSGGSRGDGAKAIVTTVPWSSSSGSNTTATATISFASLTAAGQISVWKVSDGSSTRARFAISSEKVSLLQLLREHHHHQDCNSIASCQVEAAVTVPESQLLHVLVLTRHHPDNNNSNRSSNEQEARLHWVTLDYSSSDSNNSNHSASMTLRSVTWLNRFVAPADVQIAGCAVGTNGVAYAAFQQETTHAPVIVMASSCAAADANNSSSNSDHIWEVDLPLRHPTRLLPGSLAADCTTHGITGLDSTGLGLRMRLVLPETSSSSTGMLPGSSLLSPSSTTTQAVPRLTKHLLSEFWISYNDPDRAIRVPPSLEHAAPADLEAACLAAAQQLRDQGGTASRNPLEWHLALIALLLNAGLYRRLSSNGKWHVLSIGQEVSVYQTLRGVQVATSHRAAPHGSWQEQQLQELSPSNVGGWLCHVQHAVLGDAGSGQDRLQAWMAWLQLALETATNYRQERASVPYDVVPHRVPRAAAVGEIPVWTSSPSIRQVVDTQLAYWHQNPPMAAAGSAAGVERLEAILEYAVQARGDAHSSCATAETTQAYVRARTVAFAIVRTVRGGAGDAFLWRLCKKHRYFGGLCQLALDHEARSDRDQFALRPLFREELGMQQDIQTGKKFGHFVLKWHTDRELFGHVLDYGQECPDDLLHFLKVVEALAPFRWIYLARRGDYNGTAETLLSQAIQEPGMSVSDASFAIRTASMANAIVELEKGEAPEDKVLARRRRIDQQAELINAQTVLLGENADADAPLWEPMRLFEYALQQMDAAQSRDAHVEFCETALAICTALENTNDQLVCAQNVWLRSVIADADRWTYWINSEPDLTAPHLRTTILDETIFGQLLQTSARNTDAGWQHVWFRSAFGMDDEDDATWRQIAQHHPLLRNPSMLRLLQIVSKEGRDERSSDAMIVM